MRFKEWLILSEYGGGGGAATSGMHGGIIDIPGAGVNWNMPVLSKWDCRDGTSKRHPDQFDDPTKKMRKKSYGYAFSQQDKQDTEKRRAKRIDNTQRRATNLPPDIIY